jgi:hypothetical protein
MYCFGINQCTKAFTAVRYEHFEWLNYNNSLIKSTVPEIIDPVFAKTSQNARFLLSENERFGLVFVKTGSINSGTGVFSCINFEGGGVGDVCCD